MCTGIPRFIAPCFIALTDIAFFFFLLQIEDCPPAERSQFTEGSNDG